MTGNLSEDLEPSLSKFCPQQRDSSAVKLSRVIPVPTVCNYSTLRFSDPSKGDNKEKKGNSKAEIENC